MRTLRLLTATQLSRHNARVINDDPFYEYLEAEQESDVEEDQSEWSKKEDKKLEMFDPRFLTPLSVTWLRTPPVVGGGIRSAGCSMMELTPTSSLQTLWSALV